MARRHRAMPVEEVPANYRCAKKRNHDMPDTSPNSGTGEAGRQGQARENQSHEWLPMRVRRRI